MVGVSGGLDSSVLLALLVAFDYRNLTVCHFDHALRGARGAADRGFVEDLAKGYGLPCHSETAGPIPRGQSLELAARTLRFQFYARVAERLHTQTLWLGHHADDQVETVLFRLFRGVGGLGRAGMQGKSTHTAGGVHLTLHRPLLAVWKADLERYAHQHGLTWREDETNVAPEPVRNRLRHETLPALASAMGRDVRPAVLRCWEAAAAEEDLLKTLTPAFWLEPTLPVPRLQALPIALQRRVVHSWLERLEIPDCGWTEVERVRGLVYSQRPAKVNLPGSHHARRRAGKIWIE
ncbi:MAG TPA: tRNA lysidine(34) synthetase TilS [Chthoniobacterales bacterium]